MTGGEEIQIPICYYKFYKLMLDQGQNNLKW